MAGLAFLISFIVLIVLGLPISITIGSSTIVGMLVGGHTNTLFVTVQQLAEGVQRHSLLAIPFFILAGNLMNVTGMTDRIFNFATNLVGHIRGGLAQVNVVASMIFAGVSGAAVADAAGLGAVEIRAMSQRGYSRSFSAAITLASSIIGPLIPPSIPMIIYAIVAQESVARLFLAGIVPGLLTAAALICMNIVYSYTRKDFPPPEPRANFRQITTSFKDGLLALIAPVIIVVGLTGGLVTATEAGMVAVLYALLVGLYYCGVRDLATKLMTVLRETAQTTAVIMFLLAVATAMSWFLTREGIPAAIAVGLTAFSDNPYVFLLIVVIFYLMIGTVMESITALLIAVPILLPIATILGIDPVHFGIVTVYALLLGMGTPPIGIGLFVMVRVGNIRFEDMVREFLPFFIPLMTVLLIITFFPGVWQWLPDWLLGPR